MWEASPPDISRNSLRVAPVNCIISLIVILLIWAFHGLSLPVLVVSLIAGFLGFCFLLGYWRTKVAWLSGMQFVAVLIPMIAAAGGGFWNVLSGILIALFFQNLLLFAFGKRLANWASGNGGRVSTRQIRK